MVIFQIGVIFQIICHLVSHGMLSRVFLDSEISLLNQFSHIQSPYNEYFCPLYFLLGIAHRTFNLSFSNCYNLRLLVIFENSLVAIGN